MNGREPRGQPDTGGATRGRAILERVGGAASWLVRWLLLVLFWLLLAGNAHGSEVIVGSAIAALGATVSRLVTPGRVGDGRWRARWFRGVPRALWQLPSETALLTVALARHVSGGTPLRGRFRTVPFTVGDDDASETVREALAIALDSFGPNGYVVGIDRATGHMLVHQLVPSDDPADADPAGLR